MKAGMKLASVFFLISLLAACSTPAPDNTSTPVVTGTEPPLPTATASPEPSATPTQAPLELEIVESYAWIDEHGDFRFDALVRNPNEVPIRVPEFSINLLNSSGEVVMEHDGLYVLDGHGVFEQTGLGEILPGETAPVQTCALCDMGSGIQAPEWDSYELVYELAEAPLAAYTTDLEVVVDRFRFEEIAMTDFYSLKGTVENTGNQILKRIYMVAILYDQNGHFVGSSEIAAFVDYLDPDFAGIAPGEVLDVYTELYYPEFDQPLDYEVFAIGIPKE